MEPLKILIVDDDPNTCTLLKTVLEMEAYQTASVYSVEDDDILSLLSSERPNILILDFYLGSKETLKYATAIRNDSDWRHLPVLMTSAVDHGQDCLDAGANRFILKPFNWDEITQTINEIRRQILNREEM